MEPVVQDLLLERILDAFKANIWNAPSVSDSVGMSAETIYDAMKIFHKYKQVNPITGIKNPTIVNGSWGYRLHLKHLIL